MKQNATSVHDSAIEARLGEILRCGARLADIAVETSVKGGGSAVNASSIRSDVYADPQRSKAEPATASPQHLSICFGYRPEYGSLLPGVNSSDRRSDSIVQPQTSTRRRGLTSSAAYPYVVILLAMLSHGGFALSGQGFTPFYPFIKEDFSLSSTQVGFITASIFTAATVTSTGFGWAIDRFGVRSIAGWMMMLSGAVVASLYYANTFWLLLVIAAAMGSLRPVGHPAGTKAIVDWIDRSRRGTAMSIKQAGNPVLGALAAAAVPPIAIAYGWRTAAVALGAFIALCGVLILVLYRNKETAVSGASKKQQVPFLTGIRQVARNRDISFAVAFGFPMVGAQVATLTYFMLYLDEELGIPVAVAGVMLAILQASNIVMRIGWGVISDTIGRGRRKPVLYVAAGTTAVVLFIVSLLPEGTPTWAIAIAALALGGTATSWVSVHAVLLSELSPPDQVGITIGYASTASRTGIVIAPPIFGFLADTAGYQTAWLTLVGAIALGLLFLVPIRERPRTPEPATPPPPTA